ncbi:unnamed protein product, partial [Vitis vinifera]|uniref:Uncharacterized protein n=1 Tax=Vitis vinifera TaxID=29760 RepID=D7TEY6_VITVI
MPSLSHLLVKASLSHDLPHKAFQIHPNPPKYSFQSPHIYIYGVSTLRSEEPNGG